MHIILIGFMGAGKTTVGKVLAELLKQPLLDTDQMIEDQEGISISRIFEVYGEEKFRRLETELLKKLAVRPEEWVLSVGGGVPLREENRKLLKKLGFVVYLRVQADTVLERLKGDHTRPLLCGGNVKEKVDSLLKSRGPLYLDSAHLVVDVDGRTPGEIGEKIRSCFIERGCNGSGTL